MSQPSALGNIFRAYALNPLLAPPYTDPLKEGYLDVYVETDNNSYDGYVYTLSTDGSIVEETTVLTSKTYRFRVPDWEAIYQLKVTPYLNGNPVTDKIQLDRYSLFNRTTRHAYITEFQRTYKTWMAVESDTTGAGTQALPVYTQGFKTACSCLSPLGEPDPRCEVCDGSGYLDGITVYLKDNGAPKLVFNRSTEKTDLMDYGALSDIDAKVSVVRLPFLRPGDLIIIRNPLAWGYDVWHVETNSSTPIGGLLGIQDVSVKNKGMPALDDPLLSQWLPVAEEYLL